jgi:hypothetical protein
MVRAARIKGPTGGAAVPLSHLPSVIFGLTLWSGG